ncbi:hypothetical protein F5Y18DRAFT_366903 [Xylariaceae sp. FL1019]|nr:hypothetical protein F5Y18DRAFT_366903 [Xylariaceae sp. FL1019]
MVVYKSIRNLTTWELDEDLFDAHEAYLPMKIGTPIRLFSVMLPEYRDPPVPAAEAFDIYLKMEGHWKTSEHYTRLRETLRSTKSIPVLTKFIGMALGHLVIGSVMSERCVHQHALLSALHEIFTECSNSVPVIETYVQDPAYSQRDMEVLHSAGFTIMDDPQALLELDESSLLLCIAPNLPVKEIVADICRPGIIIWNKGGSEPEPESGRVNKMVNEEYRKIDFPYHSSFGDLDILIRKAGCQDYGHKAV